MPTQTVPLKTCTTCKELKPTTEFYKIANKDTPRSQCKKCHVKSAAPSCRAWRLRNLEKDAASSRAYYRDHKDKPFIRALRKKYGLSLEEYNALLLHHNHSCAICGARVQGRKLHVDHDHKTGKVRGILCSQHNVGLGCFNDDVKLLHKTVEYLNRASASLF